MNSIELKQKLIEMAGEVPAAYREYKNSIVDAIMAHYMTVAGYYEEDATATMQGFITKQIIDWQYKKFMSI